jgi:nitroreductase
MDLEDAIRTRRTHKAFRPAPIPDAVLDELLELARWAPNHNLTNPWRFRTIGPRTREALKALAGPEGAAKLDRAPTLVAVSQVRAPDRRQDQEDLLATGVAAYIVLLGAHARGLAGYWRTPGLLERPDALAVLQIPPQERAVGLLYLGEPVQDRTPPERAPGHEVVIRLP